MESEMMMMRGMEFHSKAFDFEEVSLVEVVARP